VLLFLWLRLWHGPRVCNETYYYYFYCYYYIIKWIVFLAGSHTLFVSTTSLYHGDQLLMRAIYRWPFICMWRHLNTATSFPSPLAGLEIYHSYFNFIIFTSVTLTLWFMTIFNVTRARRARGAVLEYFIAYRLSRVT